jgi:hypothetical protein
MWSKYEIELWIYKEKKLKRSSCSVTFGSPCTYWVEFNIKLWMKNDRHEKMMKMVSNQNKKVNNHDLCSKKLNHPSIIFLRHFSILRRGFSRAFSVIKFLRNPRFWVHESKYFEKYENVMHFFSRKSSYRLVFPT